MKTKNWLLFTCFLLAALTCSAAALQSRQQALASKLIRLHVVAQSNDPADQAEKLRVRDAVLSVTADLTESELPDALPAIRDAAQSATSRPVTVTLGQERFPTRTYDNFALPAGVYRSLRVTIGAGEGQNWWCVAYPALCFRATAADVEAAAVSAGFTDADLALITDQPYTLKFKTLEWLSTLKALLLD